MANKTALILHAWYSKPESNWYPWLRAQFEKYEYSVNLPLIPTMDTNLPDLEKQMQFIDKLNFIDEHTTIVGHSLSCPLALRIAEKQPFQKLIMVAGWDFDDLYPSHRLFWPNKINHDRIKQNVKEIYCISSENDPYVTAFQAEEMSKRLGGKFIIIEHGGHFGSKEKCLQIPQLVSLL